MSNVDPVGQAEAGGVVTGAIHGAHVLVGGDDAAHSTTGENSLLKSMPLR